ncbi:MAG TPA: vitamin K epoxide reductase family protein [Bryobacteraceae bacterium]|nr:vitamin K epoxide reductase family protein [Bryobacteraceae bacterium]
MTQVTPAELGRELRQSYTPFLKRRRGIIGLSLFSCGVLAAVALYQTGILKKLPEPRGRFFDAAKVNGSSQAYSLLATPDAFLGLASYAVTAVLAGMGPENRSRTHPWMALAMGLKLFADSLMAGKLTLDEVKNFRTFSIWSLLAAAATWTALPLALPEAKAAYLRLTEQDHV